MLESLHQAQIEAAEKRAIFRGIKRSGQAVRPMLLLFTKRKVGWSASRLHNLYNDWLKRGDKVLLNKSRLLSLADHHKPEWLPVAFVRWFAGICQEYKTVSDAHRFTLATWKKWRKSGLRSDGMPGYRKCPPDAGKGYPAGWSMVNLRKAVHAVNPDAARPVAVSLSGSPVALERWALAFLLGRGFRLVKPGEGWESPAQICRRLRISRTVFAERMQSHRMPHAEFLRDQGGQVVSIASTPTFDAWLSGVVPL